MSKTNGNSRIFLAALTATGLLMLSACGGGDGEAAPPPPKEPATCDNSVIVFIICTVTQQSGDAADSGALASKSADSASSSAIGVDGDSAEVAIVAAFPGNDSLDNAGVAYLPLHSNSTASGVQIDGTLVNATAGYFVFTPVRTGLHSIYVCGKTCAEAALSDQFSLMLLDQSQTTIETTAANGARNQEIASNLVAGMAYYVEISGVAGENYHLMIVD